MLTDNPSALFILAVEDDYNHAELLKMSLQEAPEEYRLVIAVTLDEARMVIGRETPDLVLSDYRLPDGAGSDLVMTVKGRCPVILLTSHNNEQVAADAMKAGAHDYVIKTSEVFAGISNLAQRGLREWASIQEQKLNSGAAM